MREDRRVCHLRAFCCLLNVNFRVQGSPPVLFVWEHLITKFESGIMSTEDKDKVISGYDKSLPFPASTLYHSRSTPRTAKQNLAIYFRNSHFTR